MAAVGPIGPVGYPLSLKGKRENLAPLPSMPLAQNTTVTVQIKGGDLECWDADFGTSLQNDPNGFAAKSD